MAAPCPCPKIRKSSFAEFKISLDQFKIFCDGRRPGIKVPCPFGKNRAKLKDIGLFVQEIALRWIFMKICILIYFEVLNNV